MKLEKISGLWKQKDKHGNPFLSGKYNDQYFLILRPNAKKNGEKAPDYILYKSPIEEKATSDEWL